MKRKLLLVILVAAAVFGPQLLGGERRAEAGSMDVVETARSSYTTVGLNISSNTGTDITEGVNWLELCVQNVDTSKYLACSENAAVSTITTLGSIGTIVAPATSATQPAQPTCFSILAGSRFYCLASSVTATVRAIVTRLR